MLKRYGLALALASLALLIRDALPVPEGTAVYQLPIAAVVLSAWYGGRGPGLFASLICATVVEYRFIPPVNSFDLSPDYALGFFIFIALCLLLTEFGARRRRAAQALRVSEERFRALVRFPYGLALLAMAVALALTLAAERLGLENLDLPFLLIAIAVAVWYGGPRPGAAAVVAGILGHSFVTHPENLALALTHIGAFIVFALVIGGFTARRRASSATSSAHSTSFRRKLQSARARQASSISPTTRSSSAT